MFKMKIFILILLICTIPYTNASSLKEDSIQPYNDNNSFQNKSNKYTNNSMNDNTHSNTIANTTKPENSFKDKFKEWHGDKKHKILFYSCIAATTLLILLASITTVFWIYKKWNKKIKEDPYTYQPSSVVPSITNSIHVSKLTSSQHSMDVDV